MLIECQNSSESFKTPFFLLLPTGFPENSFHSTFKLHPEHQSFSSPPISSLSPATGTPHPDYCKSLPPIQCLWPSTPSFSTDKTAGSVISKQAHTPQKTASAFCSGKKTKPWPCPKVSTWSAPHSWGLWPHLLLVSPSFTLLKACSRVLFCLPCLG